MQVWQIAKGVCAVSKEQYLRPSGPPCHSPPLFSSVLALVNLLLLFF